MSSSERPTSPKQTLRSAGMEADSISQETLPIVASWDPPKLIRFKREKKKGGGAGTKHVT